MTTPLKNLLLHLGSRAVENFALFVAPFLRRVSSPPLLLLGLLARCVVTIYESWNMRWDLDLPVPVHIELVDIIIVALGFLIVFVHGDATVNTRFCPFGLKMFAERPTYFLKRVWSNPYGKGVMFTTLWCIVNAVIMLLFVREMWVDHLCIPIQILHFFPFIAVVCQTVSSGVLMCMRLALAEENRRCKFTSENRKEALSAHTTSNILHILYTLINCAVAISSTTPHEGTVVTTLFPIIAVFELLSRMYILFQLTRSTNHHGTLAENTNATRLPESADDIRLPEENDYVSKTHFQEPVQCQAEGSTCGNSIILTSPMSPRRKFAQPNKSYPKTYSTSDPIAYKNPRFFFSTFSGI